MSLDFKRDPVFKGEAKMAVQIPVGTLPGNKVADIQLSSILKQAMDQGLIELAPESFEDQ
mgnify:CR=1 FL=1